VDFKQIRTWTYLIISNNCKILRVPGTGMNRFH
jgi:hypothetical protein